MPEREVFMKEIPTTQMAGEDDERREALRAELRRIDKGIEIRRAVIQDLKNRRAAIILQLGE